MTPAGVDPELWQELLAALDQSLENSERGSSTAPQGTLNAVTDLQLAESGPDSAELSWSYRSIGDYDQNSQVNISDLTVIGLHFGKSEGSAGWQSAALADGDGNGLITIADVTPIGANFSSSLSAYSIRRTRKGSTTEILRIPQSAGNTEAGSPRLRYSVLVEDLQDGDALFVVGMDESDGSSSQPSTEVLFTSGIRPQNLTASQGTFAGAVELNWEPVGAALGYVVERRMLSLTIYEQIGTTDGLTGYTDTAPEPGQHRFYRVAALLAEGQTAYSDSAEGWSMPLPAAPLNPLASQGTVLDGIELSWEAVADADSYRVYRDGNTAELAELGDTSYIDSELPDSATHQYAIRAVNAAGIGPASISVEGFPGVIPATPQGFTASQGSVSGGVQLDWQQTDHATGYRIYRDNSASLLMETAIVTSFLDSTLSDFDSHDYWISAISAVGESMQAGPVSGHVQPQLPGAVGNLAASQGQFRGSIQLSWDAAEHAAEYYIYRDGSGVPLAMPGNVTNYTDASLPDLLPHAYTVRALNSVGQGPLSSSVNGYPDNRSEWWRFGMDNRHQSRASASGPTGNALAWSYPTGSWIRCNPVMADDGTVYFGNYASKLVALNPDGMEKWTYSAGADIYTSPAIARDGTIYIGSHDFKLHAVNPDGTQRWTYTTGGIVRSSPAISEDGRVLFGSNDHKLYCLDADGNLLWSFTAGEEVRSSPAIALDGSIYFGSGKDNQLNALNPDGSLRWKYDAGGWVRSSPAIADDGTIYVGSSNGRLHAVSPLGSRLWEFTAGGYVENCSPALDGNGRVFIGSGDGRLYCIDAASGTEQWHYQTGADIDSSPAIDAAGNIHVGSDDFKLHSVHPDGSLRWTYTTGALVDSGPLVAVDGRVYFGSSDGKLYCIGTN
ncbi:PQQ-binding-like beta-propeller repeat protein [bacterium]|nr:PQQ-binding-like beta-propeller repeat protein [bacterium]